MMKACAGYESGLYILFTPINFLIMKIKKQQAQPKSKTLSNASKRSISNSSSKVLKNPEKQNKKTKHLKQSNQVKPEGFVDDAINVGSTALDVISTGSKIVSNPLDLSNYLEAVPQTISKIVNTVNTIGTDGQPKKEIVLDGAVTTGSQEKLIKSLEREAPVIRTESVPTSFASTFTMPKPQLYQNGSKGSFATYVMTNSVHLGDMLFPTVGNNITSDYRTSLFAFGNFGGRMNNFIKLFDRFRIKSLTYSYVPACATSTPGSVHMMYRRAPKDPTTAGIISFDKASQLQEYVEGSPYRSLALPVPCEDEYLYTGDVASTDPKWYSNGFVVIGTSGASTTQYGGKLGSLYVTCTIECYGQISPDNFPPFMSGACLTRVLGMSLFQSIGHFKNEDLRNLFRWSDFIISEVTKKLERKYDAIAANPQGVPKKLYPMTSDLQPIRLKKHRKLINKNKKFRWENSEIDSDFLKEETKADLITVLNRTLEKCNDWISSNLGDKPRASNIIISFLKEMLKFDTLENTMLPWMETMINYGEVDNNSTIVTGVYSVFKFLRKVFADLSTLYSIDKELEFDVDDLPIDPDKIKTEIKDSVFDKEDYELDDKMQIEEEYLYSDSIALSQYGFYKPFEPVTFTSNPLLYLINLGSITEGRKYLKDRYQDELKIEKIMCAALIGAQEDIKTYTVENSLIVLSEEDKLKLITRFNAIDTISQ